MHRLRATLAPMALLLALSLAGGALAEAPVELSADQVASIVRAAPALPVDLGLELQLELVDFIDCTKPDDPHPMIDQGTSSVVEGPAGAYRVTAQGRNAFFSYRWRSAKQDAPHVLVVEYPDDAKREICFFTHESQMSGRANIDWSLETGVYTGNPYPLTNRMQYHTMFFWPQDQWPAVLVGNWIRQGAPAAASRIWVYRVVGDHLPAMEIANADPDPENPRLIGDLYNWSLVPVHHIFGRENRAKAFEHIVEYYQYLGCNLVAWPVVSNNSWGFRCRVDVWDGNDDDDELEGILTACDAKGLKFIASFEIGRGFTIGGKKVSDDPEAFYAGLLAGFKEFLERYGEHPSLAGICFGTPDFGPAYGEATIDILRETGGLQNFTTFVHGIKPDLKILTFVGARDLHQQYFNDAWGVLSRWENTDQDWDRHLAAETLALWKQWGRDPAELAAVEGLTTVYQYQPDDHGIYDSYAQQPRSMIYLDMDTSLPKSQAIDTRAVMLWNTFYESWFGLHPDVNYWYQKLWVAPDFNPSEPYAGAAWSRAMGHRDRNLIIAGAWNRKSGGHEASLRQFARSFRQLPPTELDRVVNVGGDAVTVRAGVYGGRTYVSLINLSPFEQTTELAIGNRTRQVALRPFGAETVVLEGETDVSARMKVNGEYADWVRERIGSFNALLRRLRHVKAEAAGDAYVRHVDDAIDLLRQGDVHAADIALGYGLPAELKLRRRLLRPQVFVAGRAATAPTAETALADWPVEALDIEADNGSFFGTHLYFPNTWNGPEDLSARVRVCHDGEKLYLGVDVRDSAPHAKDSLGLWMSKANYRDWTGNSQRVETLNLGVSNPMGEELSTGDSKGTSWQVRRGAGGYRFFAAIDLAAIETAPGESIGWLLRIGDHDGQPNVNKAGWAIDTIMMIPHDENFVNWSDARNCLELRLAE